MAENPATGAAADAKKKDPPKDRTYKVLQEDALNLEDGEKLVAYLKEKYGDGPLQIYVQAHIAVGKTQGDALGNLAQVKPLNGAYEVVAESAFASKTVATEQKATVKIT